jgi:hypothetical protein
MEYCMVPDAWRCYRPRVSECFRNNKPVTKVYSRAEFRIASLPALGLCAVVLNQLY